MLPEPNFPVKPSEFIGRKDHLDAFTEALRHSALTGRMASFSVLGNWGIGKSSLLLKLASACSDSAFRMLPVTLSVSKDISDYMRFAEALCDRLAHALLTSNSVAARLRTEIENWKLTRVSVGALTVDRQSRRYFLSSGSALLRHALLEAWTHFIRPSYAGAIFFLDDLHSLATPTAQDTALIVSQLTVSRKTKKNIFITLKLILKQGWAWGNVPEKVWESAKKIGKSDPEIRAYTDAEVESILDRSTGSKRLFYWLAVETGMRAGELCGLRVDDVDPFKKLVRVRQAVWHGKVQTPKTKNAIRDIPIPVEIVDALRTHIGDRKEGFVFATKNGTPWNADLLLRRHLRKELKVADGNLHMFRHTFATRQLNAGVPVSVVSKLLGHASISTTLNIYTHVLAEHLEQFERQRAKVLGIWGTYRAPDGGRVAEERQVAYYQ